VSVVASLAAIGLDPAVPAQTIDTRIGTFDFELGVPTNETVAKLHDQLDSQRACQLYPWELPIGGCPIQC